MAYPVVEQLSNLSGRIAARSRSISTSWIIPLVFAVLFMLAELLAFDSTPVLMMATQCTLVILLIIQAAFASDGKVRTLCLALTLLPVTRLASAGLPLGSFDPLVEEIILQAVRLAAAGFVVRYLGLGREQIGVTRSATRILTGLLAVVGGVALGLGAYALLQPRLALDISAFSPLVIMAMVGLATGVAFIEVLIFCGLLLRAGRPLLGDLGAVLYMALLFGVTRFSTFPLPYAALTVVEGVWLAWLTLRTRSIIPAILAHGLMLIAFYTAATLFGA